MYFDPLILVGSTIPACSEVHLYVAVTKSIPIDVYAYPLHVSSPREVYLS